MGHLKIRVARQRHGDVVCIRLNLKKDTGVTQLPQHTLTLYRVFTSITASVIIITTVN